MKNENLMYYICVYLMPLLSLQCGKKVNTEKLMIQRENSIYCIGHVDSRGYRTGYYQHYYEDGVIKKEGFYLDGLKEGSWKYYDTIGGLMYIAPFVKDTLNGSLLYFKDSRVEKIVRVESGIETGMYITFKYKDQTITSADTFFIPTQAPAINLDMIMW